MKSGRGKVQFLFWLQAVFFLLLLGRLIELQLIKGEKNRILAEENRVKQQVLPAGRGMIFDRKGQPLVDNIPLYRLREEGDESEYQVISREKALEIESRGGPAVEQVKLDIGRQYLFGEVLAHLLGYLGQTKKEETMTEGGQLAPGDLVGRGGVEQQYDSLLRGERGVEIFEVDALGERVRTIGEVGPQAGKDLRLSIDAELSRTAFEALEGRVGVVIATEAKTGQVIVLVSLPSFDPNKMSLGISLAEYQNLLEDPGRPFFNRAIGGVYPPGSTFKVVTAAAALEEGKITKDTLIDDPGVIRIGQFSYHNWYFSQYGRTEGEINIVRAIKRSTDTFFYRLGEKLGARRLADWARHFGLGQSTRVDLPGEAIGLVPDPDWKKKVRGERWFLGNTYHFAIGQADLITTPLQINMMTGVIANDGRLCQPKVLKDDQYEEKRCRDLKLKKETLQLIKEGMKEACSADGTAFPLFDFEPQVACKTGTAEFGDPEGRTHAWLTAFAPIEDPEIVITALVEKGGEGSRVAAPIVKRVLEAWFQSQE